MKSLILLRRPTVGAMTRTGLGKYADTIEKCLIEVGVDYEVIPVNLTVSAGYIRFLKEGLWRPFLSVFKKRKSVEVFHATDELCGVFFPLIKGKKFLTLHHVVKKGEYRGSVYYTIWNIVTTMAIKRADKIIAISTSTKEEIIKKFEVDPDKIVCISNKVDDAFHELDDVKKEDVIGCLGMLIPRKNTSSAIEAFKYLSEKPGMSNYILEICGKGPEKEMLLEMAKKLGIKEKVKFVSDLNDEEIVRFYNRSKLIFNTSLHEGIGLVTLEAQRCGTPVLHLKKAEIPEEVLRYSVECADEFDMSEKAYDLIFNNEKYESVSRSSKEYAYSFGIDHCMTYVDLLNDQK